MTNILRYQLPFSTMLQPQYQYLCNTPMSDEQRAAAFNQLKAAYIENTFDDVYKIVKNYNLTNTKLNMICSNLSKRTLDIKSAGVTAKNKDNLKAIITYYFNLYPSIVIELIQSCNIVFPSEVNQNSHDSLMLSNGSYITSICAGPGTGKTTFIINYLSSRAHRVLLLGYTKSTINTLRSRISCSPKLVGTDSEKINSKAISVMTIDSLAMRIIPRTISSNIVGFDDRIRALINTLSSSISCLNDLYDFGINQIIVDEAQSIDDIRTLMLLYMVFRFNSNPNNITYNRSIRLMFLGDPKQTVRSNCNIMKYILRMYDADVVKDTRPIECMKSLNFNLQMFNPIAYFLQTSYRYKTKTILNIVNNYAALFFKEKAKINQHPNIEEIYLIKYKKIEEILAFTTKELERIKVEKVQKLEDLKKIQEELNIIPKLNEEIQIYSKSIVDNQEVYSKITDEETKKKLEDRINRYTTKINEKYAKIKSITDKYEAMDKPQALEIQKHMYNYMTSTQFTPEEPFKGTYSRVFDIASFDLVIQEIYMLSCAGITIGVMVPSITKSAVYSPGLLKLITILHSQNINISFKNDTKFKVAGINISTYISAPGTEFDVTYAICPEDLGYDSECQHFVALSRARLVANIVTNNIPKFLMDYTKVYNFPYIDRPLLHDNTVTTPLFYSDCLYISKNEAHRYINETHGLTIKNIFFMNNFILPPSAFQKHMKPVSIWRFLTSVTNNFSIDQATYVKMTGVMDSTLPDPTFYQQLFQYIIRGAQYQEYTEYKESGFVNGEVYVGYNFFVFTNEHGKLCALTVGITGYQGVFNVALSGVQIYPELIYVVTNEGIEQYNMNNDLALTCKNLMRYFMLIHAALTIYPVKIKYNSRSNFAVGMKTELNNEYKSFLTDLCFMNIENPYDAFIINCKDLTPDESKQRYAPTHDLDLEDDDDDGTADYGVIKDCAETVDIKSATRLGISIERFKETLLSYANGNQIMVNLEHTTEKPNPYLVENFNYNNHNGITYGLSRAWGNVISYVVNEGYVNTGQYDKISIEEIYSQKISPFELPDKLAISMAIMMVQIFHKYRIY